MRYLILFAALAFCITANSQVIISDVVNAGGQSVSHQSFQLTYSIGEPIVGVSSEQRNLLQGFVQWDNSNLIMGPEALSTNDHYLYPNPCENILNVDIDEEFIITVMDIQGKCVFGPARSVKQIDVSEWAAGMYLITTSTEKTLNRNPIIKL